MWIPIRAVIIEDDPLAAQYLVALLDDSCQVKVVGSATESDAAKAMFTGAADELLAVKDADRGRIRLLARYEVAAVLRRQRRTWSIPFGKSLQPTTRWLTSCVG